jgi:hypothetical protein
MPVCLFALLSFPFCLFKRSFYACCFDENVSCLLIYTYGRAWPSIQPVLFPDWSKAGTYVHRYVPRTMKLGIEWRGEVDRPPATCPGGPGFEFRPWYRLSKLRFFSIFQQILQAYTGFFSSFDGLRPLAWYQSELIQKLWILQTLGRISWTGNQSAARPLPTQKKTNTEKTQTDFHTLNWDSNPRSYCISERIRRGQFSSGSFLNHYSLA